MPCLRKISLFVEKNFIQYFYHVFPSPSSSQILPPPYPLNFMLFLSRKENKQTNKTEMNQKHIFKNKHMHIHKGNTKAKNKNQNRQAKNPIRQKMLKQNKMK